MDNVLVTGGTGFVGRWMHYTQPPNMRVEYLSRRAYDMRFWKWSKWDYIVHLANISPTEAIDRAQGARLLYCSSGIIYHPENNTEYRQNKVKWEKESLESGVDVVIARLFTFFGEGLDDGKAIVRFEKAARKGLPLCVHGDGSCVRSYMHGSELGRWLWAILLRGESGQAYDVGSDEPVTMLELARRYSDNIIFEPDKSVPMPVYLPPNTDRTRQLLGGMAHE